MKSIFFDSIVFGYILMVAFVYVYAGPVMVAGDDDIWAMILPTLGFVFLTCIAIGAGLNIVLKKTRLYTLGELLFEAEHIKAARLPKSLRKNFWFYQLLVAFFVTIVVGWSSTEIRLYELLGAEGLFGADGNGGALGIFLALVDPNWQILPQGILAIIETIYIAFMATIFAIPIAFVLSFFAAKNIMGNHPGMFAIYITIRTILNITRSIEPLIWAIIFAVWVGIGPFSGMLALMIHSVASLTKQYSEIIECVNEGPIEGIQATGANFFQTIWYAVVPQIVLPYVSFTIYRWDINVRMATVIGLVGGGGIGTLLMMYQGQALWNEVGTLAFLIVLAVWAMDTASAYIREAIK